MNRHSKILTLFALVSFVLVLAGIGQQQTEETVTCPVSGKVMKKSEAKASYEYQGKTYYFCCENAKAKFVKEPETYIQEKMMPQEQMKGHMHMEAQGEGFCPMMAKDVEIKVENLADGVAVKITSKNVETVKKLQEHMTKMKTMCPGMASCPNKAEVKK